MAKTKALISCADTAQLICVFVLAYANCWFFHVKAHCVCFISQTMTESSVIMSMLVSHLFDPSVGFAELKTYYPALEDDTSKYRKKWDFPNRYFIMYGESIADARTEKQRRWVFLTFSTNLYVMRKPESLP